MCPGGGVGYSRVSCRLSLRTDEKEKEENEMKLENDRLCVEIAEQGADVTRIYDT